MCLVAMAASADVTVYVHADAAPYLYVWDSSENALNDAWPGKQMTETAEVQGVTFYKATFNAESINFIINNGSGNQTGDIKDITEDVYYTYDGTTTATEYVFPVEYTVTFVNGLSWENVYAYAWTGEGDSATPVAAWPGKQIEKTGTTTIGGLPYDVYTYTFSATAAPEKIIFNNGDNGEQTADLTFEADKQYPWYPIELTKRINNWDFTGCENGNFPGWTISAPNGGNTWKNGDSFVEYWIGTAANGIFDYYQTLTNLPAGKYTLSARMWNSANGVEGAAPNGNAGVYGTSGDETVFKGVTTESTNGSLVTETTDAISVFDGTLRLGVKNNGTMGARWFGVDWIKLTYTEPVDISETVASYTAKKAEAEALTSKPMNATVATALTSAINADVDQTSFTALLAAIETLTEAVDNANTSIANYEAAQVYLNAAATLDEAGQASYAANETVAAVKAAYDGRTLEAVTSEQITAMETAIRVAAKAQTTEGADMTLAIVNPSFETGDLTGWTVGSSNDTGVKPNSNGTYTTTGCDGNYLFNTWWKGIPITQTIADLPNGQYELKALMANDAITAGNSPCLYLTANGEHSEVFSSTSSSVFAEGSMKFYVTDGTATIGAIGGNEDGSYTADGYYWYKADNFRLTFIEALPDIDEIEIPEGKMSNTAAAAITAAQEAGDVLALIDAVKAAKESIEAYASAKAALDAMKAEMDATNVYTSEAFTAYNTVYTEKLAAYEDGTLSDADAKAIENPQATTNWRAANIVDNFLLSAWDTNPDFPDGVAYYINTWSTEGNSDGTNFKVPFFEYYTGANAALGEKTLTATMTGLEPGTYKVTAWVRVATKENLDTDDGYGITLQVNDGTAVDVTKGDVKVTGANSNQRIHGNFTAVGTVGENGELKIKFNVAADNNIHWLSFKNVKYTAIEPVYAVVGSKDGDDNDKAIFSGAWDAAATTDILTLTDGVYTKTFANQELEPQTIALKVIMKESENATEALNWYGDSDGNNVKIEIAEAGTYDITINFNGSIVSYVLTPLTETFTVTDAGWATAITHYAVDFTGVEGLEAYTATVADSKVTLTKAGAVPAGTPLVLKGETKAVPVVESAEAVTNDLKGSNDYGWEITDSEYERATFYGLTISNDMAKFVKLNKGIIAAGKAYLEIVNGSGARELSVVFSDDTTGINAIAAENGAEGVYNMNGQRVAAPAKGLYIVNGKKVVLK